MNDPCNASGSVFRERSVVELREKEIAVGKGRRRHTSRLIHSVLQQSS